MCNFLSSVSPQQRFEMVGQYYCSVTAQSFIWQAKESTTLSREGGSTPKERPQSVLASSFYMFCVLPRSLPYSNWASQEEGTFVSPEVLTPVHRFYLFHFHRLPPPPLFFLLATAILNSFFPILTTYHSTLKKWEAQLFGNRDIEVCGYFLLNWDGEGYWASPSR